MTAEWIATPQQVERVIGAVLPHTGDDKHLPMICCVNLELTADGRLIAVATDRYTMGIAWASLADWAEDAAPVGPIAARVFAADLRRLFAFIRTHRSDAGIWRLSENALTVAFGEESTSIRTVDVEFLTWRKLLGQVAEKHAGAEGAPLIGFAPRMVEHFLQTAKVLGEVSAPMAWHMGPTGVSAPIIRIGDSFVGVLMPVRLHDDPQLDLTALGVDAPKAVAA